MRIPFCANFMKFIFCINMIVRPKNSSCFQQLRFVTIYYILGWKIICMFKNNELLPLRSATKSQRVRVTIWLVDGTIMLCMASFQSNLKCHLYLNVVIGILLHCKSFLTCFSYSTYSMFLIAPTIKLLFSYWVKK